MPNALGGPGTSIYGGKYYYDLTPQLTAGEFRPQTTVIFNARFVRPAAVRFTYNVLINGTLPSPNQPPTANAGPNQTITLQPGQTTANVTLSGSGSDPDGTIASYAWAGTPKPADLAGPTLALGVGTYTFTLTVTDNQGAVSAPSQMTVTVNPVPNRSPTITTATLPDGHSGRSYSTPVTALDPDGDVLTFSLLAGAPAGMTISQAGALSWLPGAETEGNTYPVSVSVSDGRGGTDSRQYSVKIPDTTPPSVSLSVPKEAIPGSSFPLVPSATDNVGVTEVRLLVDGQVVKTFAAPPYRHDFTLPALKSVGSVVAFRVVAVDAAGNSAEAAALLTIAGIPDTTPPTVFLKAPATVTPGSTIVLSAVAADDQGIALLTFYLDGVQVGTATQQSPSVTVALSPTLQDGATVGFSVKAEDFSGNSATDQARATVVAQALADTTPPIVVLTAPPSVEQGLSIPVTADVTDDTGVALVEVFLNNTKVRTFPNGGTLSFDLAFPQGSLAGDDLLIEAKAVDFSGNRAAASRVVRVTAPLVRQGLLTGAVYDDSNGLPLADATVMLSLAGNPDQTATTDSRGRYAFVADEGSGRLTVTKAGFTRVDRPNLSLVVNQGRRVFDARLTPLNIGGKLVAAVQGDTLTRPFTGSGAGISSALKKAGFSGSPVAVMTLVLGPGALAADQRLTLTQVGAQGLQGRLPNGWSPVAAFDLQPHGIAFAAPQSVTVPNLFGAGVSGPFSLVRWDEGAGQWQVAAGGTASSDGTTVSTALSGTGEYALVVRDSSLAAATLPEVGSPLPAAALLPVPQDIAPLVTPQPKIIFYRPGVKSEVGTGLGNPAPLVSGRAIWANIAEEYNFYSKDHLVGEPFNQDIALFTFGLPGRELLADYQVSPSLPFNGLVLEKGIITVTATIPPDNADTVAVIGPQGGTLTSPTGEAITFPAGAVQRFIPVTLKPFNPLAAGLSLPNGFESLGGVVVSFSGGVLGQPAILSLPLPNGFVNDGDLLLVKVVDLLASTRLSLAGVGKVEGNRLITFYDLNGDGQVRFPGLLGEGRYLLLKTKLPVGYGIGTVTGIDASPFNGALVSGDNLPLVALSGAGGNYTAAVGAGNFTLTALDPVKLDKGIGAASVAIKGYVKVDLSLKIEPPAVASVTPANGATDVALADPVRIRFSESVDPATVTASAVTLASPAGLVSGTLSLSGDGLEATLRPAAALEPNTAYTITVAATIRDLAGYTMVSPFTAGFTSLNTNPPPAPPAGSVTATIPSAGGTTTVSATQGTAGLHDAVFIINQTTGARNQVQVDPDGGFSVGIQAGLKDRLVITITNPAGITTSVPLEGFREIKPDGSVVGAVGPEGGRIRGGNGIFLDVPKDAFPETALVRFKVLSEADLGVSAPASFPVVTAFEIESSVTPQVYLNVSAPMNEGVDPRTNGMVVKVVDDLGTPAFSVVDTAKIINGRLATSSPPCPGITDRTGRYAMLMNDDQRMRYQTVLTTLYPNKYVNYSVIIRPFFSDATGSGGFMIPFFNFILKTDVTESAAYNSLCMPVPPNQKASFIFQDARDGKIIKSIPVDNTSAGGSSLSITYVDKNDSAAPEIVDTGPANKTLSPSNRSLVLRFNEPMSDKSFKDNAKIILAKDYDLFLKTTGPNNLVFPFNVTFSENNSVATITPSQLLPMGNRFYLLLDKITDTAGNKIKLPYIEFFSSKPRLIFPAGADRMDKSKVAFDLSLSTASVGGIAFSDVDFFTTPAAASPDGKWHTNVLGLNGSYVNLRYRILAIDASDPTMPKVLSAYPAGNKYALKIQYIKDSSFNTRSDSSSQWQKRKMYKLQRDPSLKVCADTSVKEDADRLDRWRTKNGCGPTSSPNSSDCLETVTSGCGDLAVVSGYDSVYSLLWSYDVTNLSGVQLMGSRLLSDNGEMLSYPRKRWAPAGFGMAKRFGLLSPMDIDHNGVSNAGTMGAFVAVPGIGLELVDVGANVPPINDFVERGITGTPLTRNEKLGVFQGLYYQDAAVLGNKVMAIAGDRSNGTGIQTLETFDTALTSSSSVLALPNIPNRMTIAENFLAYDDNGDGKDEQHDYAFITGYDGGISVVEIPRNNSSPQLVAFLKTPKGTLTKHIEVDPVDRVAYVSASYSDSGTQVHALLVADVSRIGSNVQARLDTDGWDTRIIGRIPVQTPASNSVALNGFRLDRQRGLLYAAIDGGFEGDGLAVFRIAECADIGLDFNDPSSSITVPAVVEKKALQQAITKGLALAQSKCGADNLKNMTMLEQGSGACVWTGKCQSNYQPGISDHDYELFFTSATPDDKRQCVTKALSDQFRDDASKELTPIIVDGYRLTFPDITFYSMSREEFESAQLNVNPPPGSTPGDAIGDMGLGRQMLLLKWLIEGAYVDLGTTPNPLQGKSLMDILKLLRTQVDGEPSGIKRLEGFEWARLQESEIYSSGALIRLLGDGKPGTTLNHSLDKDLHKVGKAGIRAVLARMIANKLANSMILSNANGNIHLDGLACIDASSSPLPIYWSEEPCDSFEHFVASQAARITRDTGLNIFTLDQIKDLVYPLYRIKAGKDQLDTDQKANDFIARAFNFISSVTAGGGEAKSVYDSTLPVDKNSAQRQSNMASVTDRTDKAKKNGKKQIVPRFFNKGDKNSEDTFIRMYLPDPVGEETMKLTAGASSLLDTKKIPDPADPNKKIEKKYFTIDKIDQTSSATSSWVSFLADLPEKRNEEPDRINNWTKVFYYVLDPANPAVPVPFAATLPIADPKKDLQTPDNVCLIKKASIRIEQTFKVKGVVIAPPFVYAGGDCGTVESRVTNSSGQTLKDVQIYSALDKKTYTISSIADGDSKTFSFDYCPGKTPAVETSFFIPTANDSNGNPTPVGIFAPAMEIETRCPIQIESLEQDPNPKVSEVMLGGTFYRYYRLMDHREDPAKPVAANEVVATFVGKKTNGASFLIDKKYITNSQGFVTLPDSENPDKEVGMAVPWSIWDETTILNNNYSVNATLKATVDSKTCSEQVDFTAKRKPLDVRSSIKAGAAIDLASNFGTPRLSLGSGASLEVAFIGQRNGTTENYSSLSVARSMNVNAGVGLKSTVADMKIMAGGSIGVEGPTAGVAAKLTVSAGDKYSFPLPLSAADKTKVDGLIVDTLLETMGPAIGPIGTGFSKALQLINGYVTDFSAARDSRSVGMAAEVSGSVTLASFKIRLPGSNFDSPTVNVDVGGGGKVGFNITVEDLIKQKSTSSSIGLSGEVNFASNLKIGLSDRSWSDMLHDDWDKYQKWSFTKTLDKLATGDATLSSAISFKFVQNNEQNMKPTLLEMTLQGKKSYGLKFLGNTIIDNGPGNKWNQVISIKDDAEIIRTIQKINSIKLLVDKTNAYLQAIPYVNVVSSVVGPLLIMKEAADVIIDATTAEYSFKREAGNSTAFPIGIKAEFGAGGELKFTLNADYADSITDIKGVKRGGLPFKLEDYTMVPLDYPTLGGSLDKLDGIYLTDPEIKAGFHPVTVDPKNKTVKSTGSAEIRLQNDADFTLIKGIAAYDFTPVQGPVEPHQYSSIDVSGPAGKPHYGIGGFQHILSTGTDLSVPSTLIMNYHDEEVASFDKSTLKLYYFDPVTNEWSPVSGTHDQTQKTITAQVTKTGLYTIAPPMPAGKILWTLESLVRNSVDTPDESATATFTAQVPSQNDGTPVTAEVLYHVTSAVPSSMNQSGAIPYGKILSPDERSDIKGTQLKVAADGKLHLSVLFQGKAELARIVSFSDIGTAYSDQMITLE
ncbi:Ig-like domain-containing protein [Geobacter argillaceus]|nr:Ig-like domain-containing protein [Geobacter argillaceus]